MKSKEIVRVRYNSSDKCMAAIRDAISSGCVCEVVNKRDSSLGGSFYDSLSGWLEGLDYDIDEVDENEEDYGPHIECVIIPNEYSSAR